jgi:hypothetical protein
MIVLKKKKKSPKRIHRFPPPITSYDLLWSPIFRFEAQASAGPINITAQNLLDTYLVATSAIAGLQLFNFARVRKVEMWCPSNPQSFLSTTQCSIKFIGAIGTGTGQSSDTLHVASSMGADQPGHLSAKPKPQEAAGLFSSATAGNLFQMYFTTGTIIDVHISFRCNTGVNGASLTNALVGATAGTSYFRGLDGLAKAATNLPPTNGVVYQ